MTASYTPAADARLAASVLLLRDGAGPPGSLEVLMIVRAERAGDNRSGAAVFPGGMVDPGDRTSHAWCVGADDAKLSAELGLTGGGLDYAVAALRECFEEVGVLVACRPDGAPFDSVAQHAELFPWRARLNAGQATLAELCSTFNIRLDMRGLAYYSHWLTPPGMPKRFDTRFFCMLTPDRLQPEVDGTETTSLRWTTPVAALAPDSGLTLMPVTRRTLQNLAKFTTAQEAFEQAKTQTDIPLMMPRVALLRGKRHVVLPNELPYAEVGKLDPHGVKADVSAELVPGVPVQLSPRVWRVTAPNPGPMTGPGTNSYLVGCPQTNTWTVIDPGPHIESHLHSLQSAAPGRIDRILVTHTHNDHSPLAAALSEASGAPVFGRRAAHPMWQDTSFAPQAELTHGERIVLGQTTTLRVIHTPGHASNHLCFLLEEEQLLFTGDHVMQGSTVVINPPDGDMSAYLRSLQELTDEPLQWLAPGHGFLVAQPRQVLKDLIAHRLRREARVASALAQHAPCAIDTLLPTVYADVAPALYPMARRSLLAHLLKLQDDGAAQCENDVWRNLNV